MTRWMKLRLIMCGIAFISAAGLQYLYPAGTLPPLVAGFVTAIGGLAAMTTMRRLGWWPWVD